jgi:hypothetical protein
MGITSTGKLEFAIVRFQPFQLSSIRMALSP